METHGAPGELEEGLYMLNNNLGSSKITALIYLLISIVVIYIVIKTVPPYMDYYSLDDEVAQQLRTSLINTDDYIRDDLNNKVQELGLPIGKDDITLVRDENNYLSVDIKWVVTVDYGYGIKRDYPFEINSSAKNIKE